MAACADVIRLANPSLCLDTNDTRNVSRLCEGAKQFLRLQAENFVKARRDIPIAEVLMQDGTPCKTSTIHVSGSEGMRTVRRARSGKEWLNQLVFLTDGEVSIALFGEPQEMHDKTAATHHSAGVQLWPGSRTLGHSGLLISHSCFDRAIFSACSRLIQQREAAWVQHQEHIEGLDAANVSSMWHWVTSVGCGCHDFSNALRWACLKEFGSRDAMRCLWVGIESLRNSLDQLVRNLPVWLSRRVIYSDYVGTVDLKSVWLFLGLNDAWAAEFADLQLRWEDGALKVALQYRDDNDVAQRLYDCFLQLFEFRSWSDTRWAAVGRICRRLLACKLLGLSDLVEFIVHEAGESDYYIKGYLLMTSFHFRLVATSGLSGRVSEVPLAFVLADDRLPFILQDIDYCIIAERLRVQDLDLSVFEFIGEAIDCEGQALADEVHHAVVVQVGYSENRIRPCRKPPWSLVGGDVRSKLEEFKHADPPSEDTAFKIWALLQAGVLLELVIRGIDLLGMMPWSTRVVEQALSSVLMKMHGPYSSGTVSASLITNLSQVIWLVT